MGKFKTPSFIVELPLVTNSEQRHVLNTRFEAGRQIYNACLGKAIRCRNQMLQSKIYRSALNMPSSGKQGKEARSRVFKEARSKYSFTEYSLHDYVGKIRNSWLGAHVDSFTAQKLATRAFGAVNKTVIGDADKVHFKRYGELDSLEGKSNRTGIRWRDGYVEWTGLKLRAIIDINDPVIEHGLSCPVKYVRIIRKNIRSKTRYYLQLVCNGFPYQKEKNKVANDTVGLDIGPSIIVEVNDASASLNLFCRELDDIHKRIRVLQRKMDRQRRVNNPDNYNPDGTVKSGKKKWVNSKHYLKSRAKHTELYRCQAEHRKSLHGRMINDIMRHGNVIFLEKISYKAWQRMFGKSVSYRAPSMFVSRLKRKVDSCGGSLCEFPTRCTTLSQICQCGRKLKKKLSTRWHKCECGVSSQRDLYSAFLARHVRASSDGRYYLDTSSAKSEWLKIKPYLDVAVEDVLKKYWYKTPSSFGL